MEINDDQILLLANTLADRVSHIKPAPETLKMFEELDKKYEKLNFNLELHANDNKHFISEVSNKLDYIQKTLDGQQIQQKEALAGKAGKWVEKPIIGLGSIILAAFVYALIDLILKK